MTKLPQKFSTDPIFDFSTEAFGRLIVDNLIVKYWTEIEKKLEGRNDVSAAELIDIFIATLAKTEGGAHLSDEQIASLSSAEKEDFAEQLVTAEDYLYRESIREETKDEKGGTVLNFRKGDITIPRKDGEPASTYFQRVFKAYNEKSRSDFERTTGALLKSATGWASPATLRAIANNGARSQSLATAVAAARAASRISFSTKDMFSNATFGKITGVEQPHFKLPPPPRNPVHDTNERLDGLIQRFDRVDDMAQQAVGLVQSMNEAASGLLEKFTDGARSTERFSRTSIWIALIGLFVALIGVGAAMIMPVVQMRHDDSKSTQQDASDQRQLKSILKQLDDERMESTQSLRELKILLSEQLNRAETQEHEISSALSSLNSELEAMRKEKERSAVSIGKVAREKDRSQGTGK